MTRMRLLIGLFIATAANWGQPPGDFALAENQGFCSGGAPAVASFQTWGTYCAGGDAVLGRGVTQTFRLSGPFSIYLSGNPAAEHLGIRLENLSGHQSLDIRPNIGPGAQWLKFEFEIPDSWRGQDLRIVAEDQSTGPMGWLAFSQPQPIAKREALQDTKKILLRTLLFAFLLFLPGFAFCAVAIRLGIRGILKLGMLMLAGIAVPGYLLFFAYVLSPKAAHAVSTAVPYLCAGTLLFFFIRFRTAERRLLLPFVAPFALTLLASLGILSLGYLYGGLLSLNTAAWDRFSHHLPPDNTLPYLFAEGLRQGAVPRPMQADWLSSDRPPLQSGIVLALEPWMRNQLGYHIIAVISQSLWIFALWLLLRSFRISKLTTALILATIYLSGFIIVNTFFVWPKLLAAAYLIAFAIPFLAARPQAAKSSWLLRFLAGFLLACSLLSHGGTLFALLGLLLYIFIRYRRRMFKETCLVALITVCFYSPWVAYQKFVDPPGDRLLKYHLAGVEQVTAEPALKTIYQAYRNLTFAHWLSIKEANINTTFGHEWDYLQLIPHLLNPPSKAAIRGLEFFFPLPAIGFPIFGILGLSIRRPAIRKRREMRAARRLLLWAFLTTIPWILMLFEPASTLVHQGSYAMLLAAMAGSILAFRAVAPRLAIAVCLLQCVFQWIIYVPDLTHVAFPLSLPLATNHWMMALHILSLGAFAAVLLVPYLRPTKYSPYPPSNLAQL